MQSVKIAVLATAATLALSAQAQAATLVNAGFEAGLTGWTASNGLVDVVTSTGDALAQPYAPQEGQAFARLTAGEPDDVFTELSQTFTVNAAFRISGSAAFLAFDYLPYDDVALIHVFGPSGTRVLFTSSVATVGDYGASGWRTFESDVLAAGTYTLVAGVSDAFEPGGSSQLLLDAIQVRSVGTVVPEPSAWALMIAGFGGVGAALRRRPRTAVP